MRTPPEDCTSLMTERERIILRRLLLDNGLFPEVMTRIAADDFWDARHRAIFQAMIDLFRQGSPADLASLALELARRASPGCAGYFNYVNNLAMPDTCTADDWKCSVREIEECFFMRGFLSSILPRSEVRARQASDDGSQPRRKAILAISVQRALRYWQERLWKPTSCHAPNDSFDVHLKPREVSIFAGPSDNMIMLDLALHVAGYVSSGLGLPTLVFAQHLNSERMLLTLLTAMARVDLYDLRTGKVPHGRQWSDVTTAAKALAGAPIFIRTGLDLTIPDLLQETYCLHLEKGLGLMLVDQLWWSEGIGTDFFGIRKRSKTVSSLTDVAMQLAIPVIINVRVPTWMGSRQKNRDVRPLTEWVSPDILTEADVVLQHHGERAVSRSKHDPKGKEVELLVARHPDGKTGTIRAYFNQRYRAFLPKSGWPPRR